MARATIRIFAIGLSEARLLGGGLAARLAPDERARAAAYRQPDDRDRFLIGRTLLRLAAARALGCAPGAVPLRWGTHGRPELDVPGLHLSLTHSGGEIAAALADAPVGLDVETAVAPLPIEVMDVAFSRAERAAVAAAAPDDRTRLFYGVWTRKEAVLKADGRGLHDPLDAIDTIGPGGGWRSKVALDDRSFHVAVINWTPDHYAALACAVPFNPPVLHRVPAAELAGWPAPGA
jgi:4'-phosphopantetheinyl transferase